MSTPDVTVVELTAEEGRALFDRVTREELGVSGEEFLCRYDVGDFPAEWGHDKLMRVEILIPFGRR